MAQQTNSWDPGSIPGRDTSFDVPEFSCLLSGAWLQLESGPSRTLSAGEEDSVTGALKHVKSSVARLCCGGLAVMAQEAN